MQVAATKDLEAARASAAEQLQASQELVATLQAEQAEFEKRLQAAGNEADARGQQAQTELVRGFPGPPACVYNLRDFLSPVDICSILLKFPLEAESLDCKYQASCCRTSQVHTRVNFVLMSLLLLQLPDRCMKICRWQLSMIPKLGLHSSS